MPKNPTSHRTSVNPKINVNVNIVSSFFISLNTVFIFGLEQNEQTYWLWILPSSNPSTENSLAAVSARQGLQKDSFNVCARLELTLTAFRNAAPLCKCMQLTGSAAVGET